MGRIPSEEDGVCVNTYIVFLSQAVGKAVESGILGQSFFTPQLFAECELYAWCSSELNSMEDLKRCLYS